MNSVPFRATPSGPSVIQIWTPLILWLLSICRLVMTAQSIISKLSYSRLAIQILTFWCRLFKIAHCSTGRERRILGTSWLFPQCYCWDGGHLARNILWHAMYGSHHLAKVTSLHLLASHSQFTNLMLGRSPVSGWHAAARFGWPCVACILGSL